MRRAVVMGLVLVGCGSDPPITSDAGSDGGNPTTDGGTENDGSVMDAGDDGSSASACYAYEWSFQALQNVTGALGTATSVTDHVHFVSSYSGTPDLGGGPLPQGGMTDGVLVKLTPTGQFLFNVPFVGPGNNLVRGVAVDFSRAAHIVGQSSGDLSFGGLNMNTVQLGNGKVDGFVTEIRSDGYYEGTTVISAAGDMDCRVIAAHPQASHGTVLVGCNFTGTSVTIGNMTINGDPGNAGTDTLIAALSSGGGVNWAVHAGGAGDDTIEGLAIEPLHGDVVAVMSIRSASPTYGNGAQASIARAGSGQSSDATVLWIDRNGTLTRSKAFGGAGNAFGGAIAIDDFNGRTYVAGRFHGTVNFDGEMATSQGGASACGDGPPPCSDGFLIALDAMGGMLWRKQIGGSQSETADHIALSAGCYGLLVAGKNRSANLVIDGQVVGSPPSDITTSGPWAMYLASFTQDGKINWTRGYVSTDMGAAVSSGGIAFTPEGGAPRIGMSVQGQVTLEGMDQVQAATPVAVVFGLKP